MKKFIFFTILLLCSVSFAKTYSQEPIVYPASPHQTVYEESATQNFALGTTYTAGDGRVFRYCKNGAVALTKALMVQSEAADAKLAEEVQTGYTQTAGSTAITVKITAASGLTDDELAGGYLVYNKVDALSQIYPIIGSELSSDTNELALTLNTPIREDILATAELTIIKNRWSDVIVVPTTGATAACAGVPLIDVTANYYFWAQTKGTTPLVVDTNETVVIGDLTGLPATSSVAGACGVWQTLKAPWGVVQTVAAAAEPALVYLTLD